MVTEEEIAILILIASLVALLIVGTRAMLYLRSPRGRMWWIRTRYNGGVIEAVYDWMDENRWG
jgi:hypothetical protein